MPKDPAPLPDAPQPPLSRRLADGLTRLAAVARQLDWQAAEAVGLTPTQADILRFVCARPSGVRLSAAAAQAGIRKPTASEAVATLEQKALLRKQADPSDARAVSLRATAKGRRVAASWPASFESVIAGLDSDDQVQLYGLVIAMIGSLQRRQLIAPQRTCVSCQYFRENLAPGSRAPHFCALIGAALAVGDLRVDCEEHQSAA